MNRKRKILAGAFAAALLLTLSIPAFATSGDVAGAVEQTWTSAQGQIKTVVNNVVFPVLDVILAVLFFVKVGLTEQCPRKILLSSGQCLDVPEIRPPK